MKLAVLFCSVFFALHAQTPPAATFEGRPGYTLSNGAIELVVLQKGATMASIVSTGDPTRLNPLWNPVMLAREANQPARFGNGLGHFVCVDGFGGTSPEERKAGLRGHGEAHAADFTTKSFSKENGVSTLVMAASLPLVQETLTRTISMRDGESVVYVRSRLESHVAFDRPISWGEHATIGAPFLEREVTVVDLPARRSKTRPHDDKEIHRLAPDKEFTWPMAPLVSGGTVDLRAAPPLPESGDHTTSTLDSRLPYVWVTALHPVKRLLIGWVFKADDYPWIQTWEYYPKTGMLARGLEFSTQPFDIPRRDAVAMTGLFDTPTFRWLPAKSTIETSFAMFYTSVPEGMTGVTELRVENGAILIEDAKTGKKLTLKASQPI